MEEVEEVVVIFFVYFLICLRGESCVVVRQLLVFPL